MRVQFKNLDSFQIAGFVLSAGVSVALLIAGEDTVVSLTLGFVLAAFIQLLDLQKRQTDSQEQVLQRLASSLPFQILIGQKRIFDELIRMVNECDDNDLIRATGLTPEPKTFDQDYTHPAWFESIAVRIKRAKENDRALTYRTVLGKESPDQYRESIRKRRDVFAAMGVLDRLAIRSVNMTWPMEILIVGDSVFLGFVRAAHDLPFRVGLIVTHKEFARNMSEWYDDFLWSIGQEENLSMN